MAKRKTIRKTKSSALGDDPLAWKANDVTADKTEIKKIQLKKTQVKKTQVKKTKSNKKVVKKAHVKNVQSKKTPLKKDLKKNTPGKATSNSKTSQGMQIKLDSVLVINDVHTMYAQLKTMLESKQNITIDASAVEMLDTAMLQLLLAFVIKIKAQNREVIWIKPSAELISRVTTLNLQKELGLDGIT